MVYISFQQVEKGGQISTLKIDPLYSAVEIKCELFRYLLLLNQEK